MKKYRVIITRAQRDSAVPYEDYVVMPTNELPFVFQLVGDAKAYGMDVRVDKLSKENCAYKTIYERKGEQ